MKNIFEKLPLPQRQLLDVNRNMLFKSREYDLCNQHGRPINSTFTGSIGNNMHIRRKTNYSV